MRKEMKLGLAGALIVAVALIAWTACSESESGVAPAVPHSVTSTDDAYCRGCHTGGLNGAPKSPHPDRTGCTGCHAVTQHPGGDAGAGAPTIPHEVTATDAASCLACHKDGQNGAPQTPHPDRPDCTGCHKKA